MATIFFCFTYTSFSTALKYSRFFLLRRPVQDAFPPHRRERNAPGSVLAGSIGSTEGLAVAAPLYSFNCTLNENDFTLIDDQGRTYSNSDIWWDEGPSTTRCYGSALDRSDIMTMAPGQRIDIALRVREDPAANDSQFTFAVYRAVRIQDAQWVNIVPR